jgi:hypothetical protein
MNVSDFWIYLQEQICISDVLNSSIGSAVGAFLGFIGAIFLQRRTDNHIRKEKVSLLIKNIKSEVTDISESLNKYYLATPIDHRIQTPCWDAALASGFILELINDKHLFSNAITFFSLIKYLNDELVNLSGKEIIERTKDIVKISIEISKKQRGKE